MKQKGFTLIELVVVIVILGILAATALPKFVDLAGDARGSVMKGVEASMRSVNGMLYAKAAAQGLVAKASTDTPAPTVSTNGQTVKLHYGYALDVDELKKVLDLIPTTDFNVNNTDFRIEHKGSPTFSTAPQNCAVAYTKAVDANTPAVVAAAVVSGC